ncbi:MAG: trigger factor [Microthrixaceae bacterium]
MKSTIEPLEGNKVKVVVEFDEAELEPSIAQAWREIAKEVRIPGFRPGKAPRKLLEKQFGTDYARAEALKNAVPEFYSQAVIGEDIDVIAAPDVEIISGEEEGPVTFEAIVETRPIVQVAGYGSLRVEVPNPEATDAEIDEQIDRLRTQFSELVEVDRAAADGDYVTIDISGTQDGEEVDGLTADDYLYLIGSGMIASEFDENLVGAKAGDKPVFTAEHPDPDEDEVEFALEVKNVKERVLPELTDAWVADATEFETVQELRDETRNNISGSRRSDTAIAARNNIGTELAKLVEIDAPESMVSSEVQGRLSNLSQQLQRSGMRLEDFLQMSGQDIEEFSAGLKESAEESIKVDLALRAVIAAEGLEATDEEVDEEIESFIGGADMSLEDARTELQDAGQIPAVRSEIAKRKAMEWLVDRTQVVDPDGVEVDPSLLVLPENDHDHDHDHDHD